MDNEKTLDVFNTLIEINNDRIEGYETATAETEEQDLKVLFSQFQYSDTIRGCHPKGDPSTKKPSLDDLSGKAEQIGSLDSS